MLRAIRLRGHCVPRYTGVTGPRLDDGQARRHLRRPARDLPAKCGPSRASGEREREARGLGEAHNDVHANERRLQHGTPRQCQFTGIDLGAGVDNTARFAGRIDYLLFSLRMARAGSSRAARPGSPPGGRKV